MWTRYKTTIKRIKYQLKKRTQERRRLKSKLKDRDLKIAQLTRQLHELQKITEPARVFNHVYPAQMIVLAVFMVVHANGSLRCAAKTVAFYAQMMGWTSLGTPSATTIRNWVLRCGYYALTYAADKQGSYLAIIDESIQIGKEKLLLMLGIPLKDDQCFSAPLRGAQVEVLGLEVQPSWNGGQIAEFIEKTLSRYPRLNLRYVISDQGTSLLAAMRRLQLPWVSDCTHVMMNVVKRIYQHDKALSQLSADIGQLRQKLTLTDWAGLLPATLRDKDRFLRVFTIVEWADRMETYWKRLPRVVRQQIGFYRKSRHVIRSLRQVRDLIVLTSAILKTAGLSEQSVQRWQEQTNHYLKAQKPVSRQARSFIRQMTTYFHQHAGLYKEHDQVLCCSDIIESTFSRYKNKGGMKAISADVLSIALYNQPITSTFVRQAFGAVSCQTVEAWQQQNVCQNYYGLRRRMERELKSVG
jgi:phage gp16-like protein